MKTTPFNWGNATVNSLATARHSRSSSGSKPPAYTPFNLLYMPVHRIEFVTELSDQTVDHPFSLPVKQNTGVLDCPRKPMVEGKHDGNVKSCEHSQ